MSALILTPSSSRSSIGHSRKNDGDIIDTALYPSTLSGESCVSHRYLNEEPFLPRDANSALASDLKDCVPNEVTDADSEASKRYVRADAGNGRSCRRIPFRSDK